MEHRYFISYKPYKMVSQFFSPHRKKRLLTALDHDFPEDTYAVGRLDENSEGLLLLTTDKELNDLLLLPERKHKRSYIVQVEKEVSEESLEALRTGVNIVTPREGSYRTKPCEVTKIPKPDWLPGRGHEFRADLPQTWLEMILTEGKFHQVRKMAAAVGHSPKRLIRSAIGDLNVIGMKPGEVKEMEKAEMFKLLNL
ncbi:MAG: pseudouridine synthase [Bacteroidia bacterium]